MRTFLRTLVGGLFFCAYPALEIIGAVYTPKSPILQRISFWLLIFWYVLAIVLGIRVLVRRKAAKEKQQ